MNPWAGFGTWPALWNLGSSASLPWALGPETCVQILAPSSRVTLGEPFRFPKTPCLSLTKEDDNSYFPTEWPLERNRIRRGRGRAERRALSRDAHSGLSARGGQEMLY